MRTELIYWAKLESKTIWERIVSVYSSNGANIRETTITENLVFKFMTSPQRFKSHFTIFEASNERTNGNDLEIFIRLTNGFLRFACQAKKVFPNEKYRDFDHTNKNGLQVNLLTNYASRNKAIPIYFLYNGIVDQKSSRMNSLIQRIRFNVNKYGCSFVHAQVVKDLIDKNQLSNADFYYFHADFAYPFHYLFYYLNQSLTRALDKTPILKGYVNQSKIRLFSREEIFKDSHWKAVTDINKISLNETVTPEGFDPQLRIVFEDERKE